MLVRKAERFPIEAVVRGYLAGSGFREYELTGAVCGHALPAGLLRCQELPDPIFTPATKADEGHDENISEVILALNATVDGQTTAHYIADALEGSDISVTGLAQGVPIGGELDYLDDGTISAALRARRRL